MTDVWRNPKLIQEEAEAETARTVQQLEPGAMGGVLAIDQAFQPTDQEMVLQVSCRDCGWTHTLRLIQDDDGEWLPAALDYKGRSAE